ncbi:MAG: AAA family ATPase [Deltaproteobacteria bacterium]|nr:AAA family ATPase [Deltaproteobacteria bacterium]
MYVSDIRIQNYRCFNDVSVKFKSGVNVIIGENNAGKTALLKAMGLLFDRNSRPRMQVYDFYQGIEDFSEPPSITVTVTIASDQHDTIVDKALVATWLTKLESPWEARLTYQFFLTEEAIPEFKKAMGMTSELSDRDNFWSIVQRYLPKYVSRIYGGTLDAQIKAEPEFLNKFDYQFIDAIRDVESELFSGSNPMLKAMLQQVLDIDASDDAILVQKEIQFRGLAQQLTASLVNRIHLSTLLELVDKIGAEDGGTPNLRGTVTENDLMTAIKLFIEREGLNLPANYNGLGYNNLIYISLVLSSLKFKSSVARRGPNAALFPMLLIEEPEAHLHPSLQYKLLKYIRGRVERTNDSRQVFITTHSTHITAASELDSIICMCAPQKDRGVRISYPGQVFPDNPQGKASKKYVERYLDATKSNMLFAKGVIFVEGIAEQLLIPCFAEYLNLPIEEKHVAVIAVGGSTFKHFLPLFGAARSQDKRSYALDRLVSCLLDGDPMLKKRNEKQRRICWPYQIDLTDKPNRCYAFSSVSDQTQYFPISSIVKNLEMACTDCANIKIYHGTKTLEYDLAVVNVCSPILLDAVLNNNEYLLKYSQDPTSHHTELVNMLDDETKSALVALNEDTDAKSRATFATYYLKCIETSKGEHAFDLAHKLKQNLEAVSEDRKPFEIPTHIRQAILWVAGIDLNGVDL